MSLFTSLGNEEGYVFLGADWIGMSQWDELTVVSMMTSSFTDFAIVRCRPSCVVTRATAILAPTMSTSPPVAAPHPTPPHPHHPAPDS